MLSAPRELLVGVGAGYRKRPDSRGAPGSFKCPVYSTDTLHPCLTSLAEDMLVHGVSIGSNINVLPLYSDVGSPCCFYGYWLYCVVRVRLVFLKDRLLDDSRKGLCVCNLDRDDYFIGDRDNFRDPFFLLAELGVCITVVL
ncbi:hypothetical protein DPMN_096271 [Dreissena polymorpha]|uniref:Uncharacterized protein n=1 Tax=Dreissena polymorpha TaxID=45954 RepID=A0A9D4R3M7_DREPO|nr:hypothetical protein DPMN_096271 [Dreissena polymorpha]